MRINVYAEEMTDRIEIIAKEIDGHKFTGLRLYLELPVTVGGGGQHRSDEGPQVFPPINGQPAQVAGPFIHRPGDDDSSAVTFWGKRDLRTVLRKALGMLDQHYQDSQPASVPPAAGASGTAVSAADVAVRADHEKPSTGGAATVGGADAIYCRAPHGGLSAGDPRLCGNPLPCALHPAKLPPLDPIVVARAEAEFPSAPADAPPIPFGPEPASLLPWKQQQTMNEGGWRDCALGRAGGHPGQRVVALCSKPLIGDAYDTAADMAVIVHRVNNWPTLHASEAALRARLSAMSTRFSEQVEHSVALQRIVEALARGEAPPESSRKLAPHLFEVGERAHSFVAALRAELDITDKLLTERNRLLDLFECKAHGIGCVPHAIEEVTELRAEVKRLRADVRLLENSNEAKLEQWRRAESEATALRAARDRALAALDGREGEGAPAPPQLASAPSEWRSSPSWVPPSTALASSPPLPALYARVREALKL